MIASFMSRLTNYSRFIFYIGLFSVSVCSSQTWHQSFGPYAGKINALYLTHDGYRFSGTDDFGIYRTSPGSDYWLPVNAGMEHHTVWCFSENQSHHLLAGTLYGGIYKSTDQGLSWFTVNDGLTSFDIRSLIMTYTGILIAGTVSAGAFRSTDGGNQWIPASSGLTAHMILSLSVDSLNNVFAGTAGQGVFKSTDDGLTWIPVNLGMTNLFIWSLTSRGQVSLAGSMGGGVHRSTDFGLTWTPVGVSESYINALSIASDGSYFAATRGKGIFKSSNQGLTWTHISQPLPDSVFWSIQCDPDGSLYTGSDRRGVFKSADSGLLWNSYGIPNVRLLCFHKKNEMIFFSGAYKNGLFRSADQGVHWEFVPLPFANTDVNSILCLSDETVLIGTQLNGILRSDSSLHHWVTINAGLPTVPVTTLNSSDSLLFAGTFGKGIFRSMDSGANWHSTSMSSQFVMKILLVYPDELFAATLGHGIYRSASRGIEWIPINQGVTNLFVNDVIKDASGRLFAATRGGGIFRSTDNGTSWHTVNQGVTDMNIRALAVYEGRLYAGGNVLYASENSGESWFPIPSPDSMRKIIAISTDNPLAVATETNGIFIFQPAISITEDRFRSKPEKIDIRCFPNPFNISITIRFFISHKNNAEMTIFNVRGEKVKTLRNGLFSQGWHEARWDGMNENGCICASGLYFIHLRSPESASVRKILLIK